MKKFIIMMIALLISSNLFGIVAISGERESFQVMLKLELIKDDNTSVTVLDGTEYLELKTDTNATGIGASLAGVRPADGVYTKVKYTVYKFKHKLHINDGTADYYTTDKSITQGDSWALSTSIADYGYTETVPALPFVTEVTLPKPLEIVSGTDANLVFVNKYDTGFGIDYTTSIDQATWIDEPTIATAFLPSVPAQTITFDIVYTDSSGSTLTNTVTLFRDANDSLIGGYMMRPTAAALNGSFLLSGSNNTTAYTLSFQNGDDSNDGITGNDYYDINVSIDCTYNGFNALVVDEIVNGVSVGDTLASSYSLATRGSAICTTITLP